MDLEEAFVGLAKVDRRDRTVVQCLITGKIRPPMTWYLQVETNKRLSPFWAVWRRGRRSQRRENRKHSVTLNWKRK